MGFDISGIKQKIYKCIQPGIWMVQRKRANTDLRNVCDETRTSETVKIGFIVQNEYLWDKQVGIYNEARRREDTETYLFVVPKAKWGSNKIENDYGNNYFIDTYPESIKVFDDSGNLINLEDYDLNYLFYPRPYDIQLPVTFRSEVTRKHTKCCYIPYGFVGSDAFNEGNVDSPFFYNMYFCFMDSEYMRRILAKKFNREIKKKIKKVEYCGYPSLKTYVEMGDSKRLDRITWTPRWSYDAKIGGSNFLEFKDDFLNLANEYSADFCFRPHPLMFEELVIKGLLTEEERDKYIAQLKAANVIIDAESPIDDVLENTDILISDFSSIIGSFFMTGRPIIYCEKGIELNEVYSEMCKYIYVARNWNDVQKYCKQLMIDKNDYLKEERKAYISRSYGNLADSCKMIVDAIVNDIG